MKTIKKAYKDYLEAGTFTRFTAKLTVLTCLTLLALIILFYLWSGHPKHYEMLLMCDELFTAFKSISGIGIIGTIVVGCIEKSTNTF